MKATFLQTGRAKRDKHVRPPRDCANRRHYWLLLSAVYGLYNANARTQTQSDSLMIETGSTHLASVPQLFYSHCNNRISIAVVKIVDDRFITGDAVDAKRFVTQFGEIFKFRALAHDPGTSNFFGMTIEQLDDYSMTIHANQKLNAIKCFPLLLCKIIPLKEQ